jgi:hypothetical protein
MKYSAKKIRDDLNILHYFSLEIPANKAAKDLIYRKESQEHNLP